MTDKRHQYANPATLEDADHAQPGSFAGVTDGGNVSYVNLEHSFICFSAYTYKPEGSYRYCQPMTGCALWVCHPCAMPLPSTAFDGSEGLLYPHTQAIPADIGFLWLHISDDEPWLFVGFSPVCQQYTVDLLAFGLKECSITGPGCPRFPGIAGNVSEAVSASWTEHAKNTSAHEGMPSQSSDTMEQISGEKPTISKSNDCHVVGDTWFEQPEHTKPMLIPCSFSVPFENLPRHRDSTSPVEHT